MQQATKNQYAMERELLCRLHIQKSVFGNPQAYVCDRGGQNVFIGYDHHNKPWWQLANSSDGSNQTWYSRTETKSFHP